MRPVSAIFIFVTTAFLYTFCAVRRHTQPFKIREEEVVGDRGESVASTPIPQIEQPTSTPATAVQDPPEKKEPQEDPYRTDPFTKRRLNQPMPKSITELLTKMDSYEMPKLPVLIPGRPVQGDGSVLAHFSGFYEGLEGSLRKITVSREVGNGERIEIGLEENNDEFHEWSTDRGELTIKNFDDDRYSLVIGLPDGRLFYFKFFDNQIVASYHGVHFRVLKGWLLEKAFPSTQLRRMALIDHWDRAEWPDPEAIRNLLPDDVLAK